MRRGRLRHHRCVLLAIDPGKDSGVAVFIKGQLMHSGNAKSAAERSMWVTTALEHCHKTIPIAVVMEKWSYAGGKWGPRTMQGLAEHAGRWNEILDLHSVPKSRRVRVFPATWRAAILGGPQRAREEWHKAARDYVKLRYPTTEFDSTDEAEAICIGEWGARADSVYDVLPRAAKVNDGEAL